MAEERSIRIEDDEGNSYYPHSKAKTTFLSNGSTIEESLTQKVDKIPGKKLTTEDYTTAEKQKLLGIAAGANNYVHPSKHSATMITQDANHRFVTDNERNKLNGIATGAEVNQNAISKININDKFITASKKEDSIELKLDKNFQTNVTSNVMTIAKRIKTERLNLMVDKTTGVDDYNENTPFKTIQAALDYIKTYYSGLEKGCLIKIAPGEYDYFTLNNFNVNYGVIELESSETSKIPSGGTLDESYTVNLTQFKIHNNATNIILRGFSIRGLEPTKMTLGTDGKYPYVTLFDILSNANVVLHKCNIYGSNGNFAGWKWYYGIRPYYSKVFVRDCKLGQFTSSVAGGNSAPIRVVDNSDVVLLFDKFEGNSSYDIIAEESRIHIRNCSRTDGKPLKKSISKACLIAEG